MSHTNSSRSEQQSKRLRAQEELPFKTSTMVRVGRLESLQLPQDMWQPEWAYRTYSWIGECQCLVEYFEGKVTLHYWYKTFENPNQGNKGKIMVSYQKFDLKTESKEDLYHVYARIDEGKVTQIYALWASRYEDKRDLERLMNMVAMHDPPMTKLLITAVTRFSVKNMIQTFREIMEPHPAENLSLVKRGFGWTVFTALDKAVNKELKGKMNAEHTVCVSKHFFEPVWPEWRVAPTSDFDHKYMDPKDLFEVLPPLTDL